MKKLAALILVLSLLVSASGVVTADSGCSRHRWVEATEEDPAFCYYCGTRDYTGMNTSFLRTPFTIRVYGTMNIRRWADLSASVTGQATPGVYTVTEVSGHWGKLKSGGWISMVNAEYVSILSEVGSSSGNNHSGNHSGNSGYSSDPSWLILLRSARVGDTVTFGRYEQDGNLYNGKEPITWRVLDRTGGRILLISTQCLECSPYNTTYTSVSWETCTLRSFLNGNFLYDAFSDAERNRIPSVVLRNPANATYGTTSGRDTTDRVFILSVDEARAYFSSDVDRMVTSTTYARSRGTYVSGAGRSWYWLRGAGEFATYACLVGTEGNANDGGNFVDRVTGAVRPALWVDIS